MKSSRGSDMRAFPSLGWPYLTYGLIDQKDLENAFALWLL